MRKPDKAIRREPGRNGEGPDTPAAVSFPPHVAAVLADADRAVQALAGGSHHRLYQALRQSAARLAPVDAFYVGFYQAGRHVSFPYSFDGREYDDPAAIPYGDGGLSAWILARRRPYWSREDDGRLLRRGQTFGDTERISADVIVVPVFDNPHSGNLTFNNPHTINTNLDAAAYAAPSPGAAVPEPPPGGGSSGDPRVLGLMSMQSYLPGAYDAVTVRAFAWLAGSLSTVLAREREDERRRAALGAGAASSSHTVANEVAARLGELRRGVDAVARMVPPDASELSQAVAALREGCERTQTEIAELLSVSSLSDPLSGLTARQREVALLLAEGLGSREIAERLFISEHTAKDHQAAIRTRLGVPGRSGVAALLRRVLPPPG